MKNREEKIYIYVRYELGMVELATVYMGVTWEVLSIPPMSGIYLTPKSA